MRFCRFLWAIFFGVALAACGGGSSEPPPSGLTYSLNPAVYSANAAIASNTPSNIGGAVVSYSVLPALPAGLSLNTTTGAVSGTPSVATGAATYTVTATNSAGSATVGLSIAVTDAAASPVSVNTVTATMDPNTQRVFMASVVGFADKSVTWSTSPPNSGTLLTLDAFNVAYTAPATGGQIQLTATSVADANATATVTITVNAAVTPSDVVYDNWNLGGVNNGPSNPTTFSIPVSRHILYINTYHYFNGGALPGLLSLRHSDGTVYGPWQTTGSAGQGGVSNAVWNCYPDVDIKAGDYTVVDSDPSTWSVNGESGGSGFAHVTAIPLS